jgi:Flp pilus assembly protein TadB
MTEVIGTGLFALAAALLAVAYQYWQFRRQMEESRKAAVADQKKRVIEALIAHRFVLVPGADRRGPAADNFNSALSVVPVHFSHCKACMDSYRTVGDSFTSEKFFILIKALMEDVPLSTDRIDKHLLENVPGVRPQSGGQAQIEQALTPQR